MFKRDRIFYFACAISCAGVILAIMGYEFSLLLFVAAYLLRPALHEFGLGKQYADERELAIHSRSGNLAFVILILAAVGMVFWRLANGQSAGELYTLIGIGLAARALTGLVMAGEFRKAGAVIISAIAVFLTLFIVLDGGFSLVSIFGLVLGGIIFGFGQLGRKFPRTISVVLALFAVCVILFLGLYNFRRVNMAGWLFIVTPIVIASACLFLGRGKGEDVVSAKTRSIVFGSLGVAAATVFTLLIVIGGREEQQTWRTSTIPEGQEEEIQGVACSGRVEYYENGNLKYCDLAREDTLSGQPLAAGTGVHFTEDGVFDWCFLREDTEIQGYLCRGEGHGFMTVFHPNGKVRNVYLADDEVIQGIPCARFRFLSAVFNPIHHKYGSTNFYDDGSLKYCELSENFIIEGQSFRRGDALRFDRDGRLISEME